MNAVRAIRLVAIAFLGTMAVAACTHGPPPRTTTTTTTTTTPPVATLLEYSALGGLCPVDLCGRRVTVLTTGGYHLQVNGREIDGQLDAAATRELTQAIRLGVATLADLPRGGPCPSIRDGQDITYRFHVDGRVTQVSNCTHVIPGGNALLIYTNQFVQRLIAEATAQSPLLLEWDARGGLCPWGLCHRAVTINRDGTWHAVNGTNARDGALDPTVLAELTRRVGAEVGTLATLTSHTGGCASAYDGTDLTYRLYVNRTVTTVSSCTKNVPGTNGLLLYIDTVVGPIAASVPDPVRGPAVAAA